MRLTLLIKREKPALATLATLAAVGMIAFGLAFVGNDERAALDTPTEGVTAARFVAELPPAWPLSLSTQATREVEGEFRRGDTFSSVLSRAGVPGTLIDRIVRAVRSDFDVQKIRAGRPYKVYFGADDELLLFRYRPDKQTDILVAQAKDGWQASDIVVPYEIRTRFIHADIRGSLEGAVAATWVGRRDAINLSHKLADIFAWDIDFAADLRVNDTVDVVVEQRFLEGEFAGFGDVLAAEMNIRGRPYKAVRYARPGAVPAYFTPTGESLQRAFLRSPVTYSRISSGFSYRRKHPVLDVVRPHRGVDYVAPAGTPVHSTAEGTVTYVGRNGQAGNHVKVRHGGSYTSWYLHLRGFASDLSVGDHVEQGQVIGFVGSTGLTTSAHLHYQLERNGQFVDPLQIDFPAAAPLPPEHMSVFTTQRDEWMSILRQGQQDRPLVLAGSGE